MCSQIVVAEYFIGCYYFQSHHLMYPLSVQSLACMLLEPIAVAAAATDRESKSPRVEWKDTRKKQYTSWPLVYLLNSLGGLVCW